jgi:hypothetical protein
VINLPVVDGSVFLPVAGWPGYAVSDQGEVWSYQLRGGVSDWRRLSLALNTYGYPHVNLRC